MAAVRAFVGHSFTKEDEDVCREFLTYFDQMARSVPDFSWVHAEEATASGIVDKVLRLIEGKNLFIGICTRKEYVGTPSGVRQLGLPLAKTPAIPVNELVWKTSDWIIQEVGLAIGRGMNLILLIEEGVRPPGALQRDGEYIVFSRDAPQRAFGKLLDMVNSLAQAGTSLALSSGSSDDDNSPAPAPDADDNGSIDEPQSDWTIERYERAAFIASWTGNADAYASIDTAFKRSDFGKDPIERAEWDARHEWGRVVRGEAQGTQTIRELALVNPTSTPIKILLARSLSHYKDYPGAEAAYLDAVAGAGDAKEALEALQFALQAARAKGEAPDLGYYLSEASRFKDLNMNGELAKLALLREVADLRSLKELSFALAERRISLEPADTNARFELAYGYSNTGHAELALMHYVDIPDAERSSMAWNNLGVEYAALGMQGAAVEAYLKAAGANETLAESNLALKLLEAGFMNEAQERCERAIASGTYHENVPSTLDRIRRARLAEASTRDNLLNSARPQHAFYARIGKAALETDQPAFQGAWQSPECTLKIEEEEVSGSRQYTAVGKFARPVVGLGITMGEANKTTVGMEVRFILSRMGNAFEGVVTRQNASGQPSSFLSSFGTEVPVLLLLNAHGDSAEVWEQEKGIMKLQTWSRLQKHQKLLIPIPDEAKLPG